MKYLIISIFALIILSSMDAFAQDSKIVIITGSETSFKGELKKMRISNAKIDLKELYSLIKDKKMPDEILQKDSFIIMTSENFYGDEVLETGVFKFIYYDGKKSDLYIYHYDNDSLSSYKVSSWRMIGEIPNKFLDMLLRHDYKSVKKIVPRKSYFSVHGEIPDVYYVFKKILGEYQVDIVFTDANPDMEIK